ncbi:MAG: DUF1858 domain-containing protein [candidate division Zixibacteria bacterium]|nr:DUF1858 domain-containing protein [candidate division Zixibacteria bacterium]
MSDIRLMITRDANVEELVKAYQGLVGFLIEEGLPCVICGEPFWGSLEDLALQKGWDDDRIDQLVGRLNARYQ